MITQSKQSFNKLFLTTIEPDNIWKTRLDTLLKKYNIDRKMMGYK